MFCFANDQMRQRLREIRKTCFNESDEALDMFFNYRFRNDRCAVYCTPEGVPAAFLNMFPADITEDNVIEAVMFIYGCAVLPEFRGKGIMASLLEFARRAAVNANQKYIVLVPADKSQKDYFKKQGYYSCFCNRKVYFSKNELKVLIKRKDIKAPENLYYNTLDAEQITRLRRDVFAEREGYISWGINDVAYAAQRFISGGGKVLTVTDGIDAGCAFYSGTDEVYVSEYISGSRFEINLVKAILNNNPKADRFIFRLPPYDGFFEGFGEIREFAMVMSSDNKSPVNLLSLKNEHAPFIGLTLD